MSEYVTDGAETRRGFVASLDRIETMYLALLRGAVLVLGTILLIVALVWLATSLYKLSRSPSSVIEQPATVKADDILPQGGSNAGNKTNLAKDPKNTEEEQSFYRGALNRYHALYQSKYRPFQRQDDKVLDQSEFDDMTLNTTERLTALRERRLSFVLDKADVDAFLAVVSETSDRAEIKGELARYRNAKKQAVTEQVTRTRTETRRGWNPYSTDCSNWYESPIGCSELRSVNVPYTQAVTTMRYPENLTAPITVLKNAQDRYFDLLSERREQSAQTAQAARERIMLGKLEGRQGLSTVVTILVAFLVLMFFFLLVAIERHQRRLVER